MNINKFVFMVRLCNVYDAMLEQFCVQEATGHEIYRARLKNCWAALFTGWEKKELYPTVQRKEFMGSELDKKRFVGE